MFEPLDIICKTRYEEFVSYLPCYRKSKAATQVRCSNICGEPEAFYSDMQKKFNTPIMQRNEDGIVSAFNELIQTTCNYASCHHRCQWRVIIEKCPGENGQNAAEFMSSFSEQAIKSVSKGMKAVAPQIVVPDDCLSREDSSPAINRSGRTNSANVIDEEY
uniref:Uncharacterized protein n=1 Tax=Plectus sambesii TaxID=2011161 RepID=A0A914USA5_9BILA